jgi:beta-lactamase class A
MLTIPLTLALAFTAAQGTPPRALHSSEIDSLKASIGRRVAEVKDAVVGVAFRDMETGDTLYINADDSFHAASTMKVPVMIELYRRIDAGTLSLDQGIPLANQFASIVDGSPFALDPASDSDSSAYLRVGSRVPVRELGATNMRVLRGVEDTKAFQAGLNNTTTARDLAALMFAIETGTAASRASCDAMRTVLLRQEFNGEIPAGLPAGIPVAHKTGFITGVLHDAAIVYPAHRKPYVLVVLTRGIPAQPVARQLIADISRLVYEHAVAAGAPRS